jgi:hypothetical protein
MYMISYPLYGSFALPKSNQYLKFLNYLFLAIYNTVTVAG